MRRFQLLILMGVLFMISCSNNQYRLSYLSRIDSLRMSLEAGASSYEQIDTPAIEEQFNTMNKNLELIKADSNIARNKSVTIYNHVRKAYKTFLREKGSVSKELNYTRSQLDNLKKDVEKRRLDEEELSAFFEQEKKAVTAIKEAMDYYQKRMTAQMHIFDELNPIVEQLTDSLKTSHKIEK